MLNVIFDGPPGPVAGRFVEVENDAGESVRMEWTERPDGYWALRFYGDAEIDAAYESGEARERERWQARESDLLREIRDLNAVIARVRAATGSA